MVRFKMNQTLRQNNGVTDQSANQPRTTEDDSERAAYEVTGVDAHMMRKDLWEQLGEPTLQTPRVTLRGANGEDLRAMGELLVRCFIGKIKVQSTAVIA